MITSRTLAHTVLELANKPKTDKYIEAFFEYVQQNNLEGLLPQMREHLEYLLSQQEDHNVVYIRTPYNLNEKELTHIAKTIGSESAPIVQHLDETVIGGFSATYQGNIYEGSIDHFIDKLNTKLIR